MSAALRCFNAINRRLRTTIPRSSTKFTIQIRLLKQIAITPACPFANDRTIVQCEQIALMSQFSKILGTAMKQTKLAQEMCKHSWPLFLLLVGLFAGNVRAASYCSIADKCDDFPVAGNQARYDHYRMYHVELDTAKHVQLFQQLEAKSDSCTFYGHAREPGQKLTIMVAAHKVSDFVDLLTTYEVKHRVLTANFQEKIDRNYREVLPITTKPEDYDWAHYFHLDTIDAWLQHTADKHPQQVTLLDMGKSTQGLPMKGVRIAFDDNESKSTTKTTVFIESGIHAREWIAPATATYLIDQLLTSTQPDVQRLARTFNWIIFPVVNPDGYKYTFDSDRMWRKNRALFGICRGVDLNRNYPEHWNTTGTSGDPCAYDYSGPAAGSEAETQRLIAFMEEHVAKDRIRTYISLHSFSQMIMFPYSHTPVHVENYDDLKEISRLASERIRSISGRDYKYGSMYETIYPSSGGSKDWVHGHLHLPITFTFELRGPPDSEDLFILPAVEILPTAEETLAAIVVIMQEAEKRNYYK